MDDATGDGERPAESSAEPTIVDSWLEPLGDPACGEDLEYDNSYLELSKAAAGKPGTQFAEEPVPPDWRSVSLLAEELFGRTRDLRVAIFWTRARIWLDGASTLAEGLRLIHGLLDRFWDELYPVPDDGDAYARINALNDMCSAEGLLGDLRQALIVSDRSIGELRGREIEIALGVLEARDDESPPGRDQIEQMLRDAVAANPPLGQFAQASLALLDKLGELMRERVGYDSAPDLAPLVEMVSGIQKLMPREDAGGSGGDVDESGSAGTDDDSAASGPSRASSERAGFSGAINTREEALRAIDLVCDYLERTEPTNPAQLFLRRARRLVNKNFLQLVHELAPDALAEVARIMGVSADDISAGSSDD